MFGDSFFSWFKSSKQESAPEATWDPNTVTMAQPQSPAAPTTEGVVTGQPVWFQPGPKLSSSHDAEMKIQTPNNNMDMSLRGGGPPPGPGGDE